MTGIGIMLGGLGMLLGGIAAIWWVSMQDDDRKAARKTRQGAAHD